jgi:CRP/FNR family cyclic AMP-dependent transcriptional regulator
MLESRVGSAEMMKERFEGDGQQNLVDSLMHQELVSGAADLAEKLASSGQVVECSKGDKLITEGGEDNDIYMLLAGSVAIVVKGNNVAIRKAGQHVGEMAALEPAQKRAATVVALDTIVALKLTNAEFMSVGWNHPQIWLPIARELARRLLQRNDLIQPPNDYPKLFVIPQPRRWMLRERFKLNY